MRVTFSIVDQYRVPILIFLIFIVSACGVGGSKSQINIGTGGLVIEFPHSLERHIADNMDVKATITLDGADTYPLAVDKENKEVTGKIGAISDGQHVLVVEYFIIENGTQYSIAKGTIYINVDDIEIVSLIYDDFIYEDDDYDGITNIAELQLNTNPFDSQSKPDSHGLHGSENYRFKDNPINSNVIISFEISKSQNYTIQ